MTPSALSATAPGTTGAAARTSAASRTASWTQQAAWCVAPRGPANLLQCEQGGGGQRGKGCTLPPFPSPRNGYFGLGFAVGGGVFGLASPPTLPLLHAHMREQQPICLLALREVPHPSHMSPVTAAAALLYRESVCPETEGFVGLACPAAMPPELDIRVGRL